ncbi:oxidoreductase [Aureococcus anophagefferens]|nr:oxidoreductase [Aureococcus anophagefferens]
MRLLLLLASALALPPTPTQKRRYDLVIYGATGFTGRLAAEYMESRYRKTTVTWALAGRNRAKLESLAKEIGADDVPLLVADANDADAVAAMVGDAKAVANFAGTPFLTKALPVVEACGRLGTHYVDITGETALHRASAARYDALAKSTGACVVHSCGYDSVPSDLGYLLANDAYRHLHGGRAPSRARYVSRSFSGGASGGSIYTGLALFGFADELFDDDARRLVAETSGKYPLSDVCGPDATDTEIYGDYVPYDEVEAYAGSRVGAYRYVLPKPGEGPDCATRDGGGFHSEVICSGVEGAVSAHVKSGTAGDGGYKATAHMAVEAALGLALGDGGCEDGGVLTPATALGYVPCAPGHGHGPYIEEARPATALHYLQAAKG